MDIVQSYEKMYKIRKFEEKLLQLFSENKLKGTTHTSIGQEAVAVSVMNYVTDADFVFSNHRCHGHFIAYSDNMTILLSEIMGKKSGMCRGRGGSQHICYKHFYSNGVQGGIVPDATGIGLAEKLKGRNGVAIVFIGDGTLGQGVVYESFNMASLYNVPILYVVEDNGYAMTTSRKEGVAGNIRDRAVAFDIAVSEIETNDVELLYPEMEKAFDYVRKNKRPFCQIIHTYRLAAHSKGDDYRDPAEVREWKKKDPLKIVEKRLSAETVRLIQKKVERELQEAVAAAENAPIDAAEDIYEEYFGEYRPAESLLNKDNIRCVESLNAGLEQAMSDIPEIILLGEDIRDPYGGAFKVTRGLSQKFPDRVINTPISEAGFIGMSVGMALNGLKPVPELMFGDFITLGFDQILNHATKFRWMYAEQVSVPMLIRIPMGGGRGYGATHSQSLEKYFVGIPNLRIIALSRIINAGELIYRILKDIDSPVILLENKKMYSEKLLVPDDAKRIGFFHIIEGDGAFPVYHLTMDKAAKADASIVTYGAMTDIAMAAAEELMVEDELMVDIIVNTTVSPLNEADIIKAIGNIQNVIALEEGTVRAGWGSEVIAMLSSHAGNHNYARIGAKNCVIPSGNELEEGVLPKKEDIIKCVRRMCNG